MRPQKVTAGSRNATEVPSLGVMTQTQHLLLLGAMSVLVMGYLTVI